MPALNIRIRQEDKGHRFVLVDGELEDAQIEASLQDPEQYEEVEDNPMDIFKNQIEEYAARKVKEGELTEQQYRFVTNTQIRPSSQQAEELHLANPKPQPKTHKVDDEENLLDPLPSRVITVGSGTVPHPLSKLCSEAIKHLVTPQNLPRNNTKTVVSRLIST